MNHHMDYSPTILYKYQGLNLDPVADHEQE